MTYGLVCIVKDEAAGIEKFLTDIKPRLSHWVICDTGSTDGTQDIIRRVMEGVPGELYEDEWVNFGHNRTLAFARAFKTADWLLALDADMTLTFQKDFRPSRKYDAYALQMGREQAMSWWVPLILRGDLPWISVGAMHEYTILEGMRQYKGAATSKVLVDYIDRSSPEKLEWQADLLRREVEKDPSNPRNVFYLAQTYKDQRRVAEARELYLRRAKMGGWDQEVFWSKYMAAANAPSWPEKLEGLLTAWSYRPARLEPLYDAVHGLTEAGAHAAAYALCPQEMPPITRDSLFVFPAVYAWGMELEKSVAAWNVGRWEESRTIGRSLLERDLPPEIRASVEANVALPDPKV